MDDRRAAFEALFAEHHPAVLRYIGRRVDQREQARELAMDCFEVAWKRFDPQHPFGLPWLLRTAHNIVGDSYRRRDRERVGLAHLADIERLGPETGSHDHVELSVAMDLLPEPDREVLMLVYWDGLSAADAAQVIGCRVPAVWKRLSRARDALRALLDDDATLPQEVNELALDR
ncbi:RNA polymerase sigma factor [Salinibacterium sp. ZJ450]|uniref:RNA polymerase sigma factor n=1 Tax=Salinibacterium sp. ZJ450 TaxID=2708338 RepID=UPI00141FFA13|nr:sigma-70 family RNA polymerase sigma factor [Salinibacterium sp. ZJ450]